MLGRIRQQAHARKQAEQASENLRKRVKKQLSDDAARSSGSSNSTPVSTPTGLDLAAGPKWPGPGEVSDQESNENLLSNNLETFTGEINEMTGEAEFAVEDPGNLLRSRDCRQDITNCKSKVGLPKSRHGPYARPRKLSSGISSIQDQEEQKISPVSEVRELVSCSAKQTEV